MEHVISNNPIDEKRLSTFGLSSGGYGVWELISTYILIDLRLLCLYPQRFLENTKQYRHLT